MYTTPTSPAAGNPHKRNWRKHSDEFKARVVALALEPHASMASVALANGINANMLRCWVRASSLASSPSTVARDDRNVQALSAGGAIFRLVLPHIMLVGPGGVIGLEFGDWAGRAHRT